MKRRNLLWIFGLAVCVRIVAAAALAPTSETLLASAHHEHASIAKNLAEGRGFRFNFFGDIDHPDLSSQQAPWVPGVVAGAYLILGIETAAALWFVVVLQTIAGAAACVALADAVRIWSGDRRIAATSGIVSACYPPFVFAAVHVQALPWNLLWIAAMLAGAARLERDRRLGQTLFGVGAVCGIHTDPILAAAAAALGVRSALLGSQSWKKVAQTAAVVAVVSLPWLARNYAVHGRFVFVKNSLPYVFWQGNTRLSAGTDKTLLQEADVASSTAFGLMGALSTAEAARLRCRSINEASLTDADLRELRGLPNESARMQWFGRRIRNELSMNPWHYVRMCGVRLRQWVWFDETNPKSYLFAYRACYVALLGGSLIGLASASRLMPPFLITAFAISLIHVLIITSARFRVCAELLMVPPCAAAVVWVGSVVLQRARFGSPISAAFTNSSASSQ